MVSSIAFCTERGEIGTAKMPPKLLPKTVLSTMRHQMTLQFTKVQITFGENGGEMTGKATISFEKQVAEIYETAALSSANAAQFCS